MIGISVDDAATQRRFRAENALPFPLLSDPGGTVAGQYGGTMPVIGIAKRATFVIGQDGIVQRVFTGGEALDPAGAVSSCPMRKG